MLKRCQAWLAQPRAPLLLGLLATVLCLPALSQGLQADDLLFPWKLEQGAPIWSLFEIEAATVPRAREQGFLVWWSNPALVGKFLRPLASLSHALEFSWWPRAAWAMRLINALIYGVCVALAAGLYRRLAPSISVAGLAGLLFALDDGHAFSAGWISGRNTLLALLFALLALALHVRARERGRANLYYAASCVSVALALASAEAGVWSLALLVSYALALETGSLAAKLRSVAAPLALGALWALIYRALDCGFRGTSFYRDPGAPVAALTQGLLDLPVWFADLFGPSGAPLALLYPALWVRLGTLPVALGLAWLLWPALRSSRECRFFALATLLCLAPVLHTLPTSRVLLGPSFGAIGWIGASIVEGRAAGNARGRWTAGVLVALHLVLAPLCFFPALQATQAFANGSAALVRAAAPRRDVIVVQTPVELLSNYALLELTAARNAPRAPRSLQQLYTGASALWVERVDARTLELTVDQGWGHAPIERIFCDPDHMPRAGAQVRLGAFTAHILRSNADGMPERVRFTFPSTLEAADRQWLTWQGHTPAAWSPPPIGGRVRLAPLPFFSALRPGD